MAEENDDFHDRLEARAFRLLSGMGRNQQGNIERDPMIPVPIGNTMLNVRRDFAFALIDSAYQQMLKQDSTIPPRVFDEELLREMKEYAQSMDQNKSENK
jgi:hypothetical protein